MGSGVGMMVPVGVKRADRCGNQRPKERSLGSSPGLGRARRLNLEADFLGLECGWQDWTEEGRSRIQEEPIKTQAGKGITEGAEKGGRDGFRDTQLPINLPLPKARVNSRQAGSIEPPATLPPLHSLAAFDEFGTRPPRRGGSSDAVEAQRPGGFNRPPGRWG